jgi:RNA polymerase sigma-70 factor, ECF subfamily
VDFQIFDAEYVRRLKDGDPDTESRFSTYFERFLSLKLRARRMDPAFAEDVRQETLFRVLKALRQGSGVAQPERFGAFVNSVCNNVVLEFGRKRTESQDSENAPEAPDDRVDIQAALITKERKRLVAKVLDELAPKDREILRLVFLEEWDRKKVCEQLKVDPDHLRVLLYRAKARFQAAYSKKQGFAANMVLFVCNALMAKATI